jgi:hypothetical protein
MPISEYRIRDAFQRAAKITAGKPYYRGPIVGTAVKSDNLPAGKA